MNIENSDSQTEAELIRRPARLYHKKSRNGCRRCKDRRVKCDEAYPTCGNCTRHMLPCIYEKPQPKRPRTAQQSQKSSLDQTSDLRIDDGTSASETPSPNTSDEGDEGALVPNLAANSGRVDILDIPESSSRRLIELRLLHNYITNLSQPSHGSQLPEVKLTWSVEVPRLAMQHENLLYTVFAASALDLLRSDPNNAELLAARQSYLSMALNKQSKAVSKLSNENADAICFASLMILCDTFATLQDRVVEPYSPPMEWLRMGRGAGAVFCIALNSLGQRDTAKVNVLVQAHPTLNIHQDMHAEENRKPFLELLDHNPQPSQGPSEVWDADTREAYEKTLNFIGSIKRAINNQDLTWSIARRLLVFVLFVPKQFVEFVAERRPRALVILAHYFSLASQLKCVWWIGNSFETEICAIHKFLPPEWQEYMSGPLSAVGVPQ